MVSKMDSARCGVDSNPHIFKGEVKRCTKCNKHIRDIGVWDSLIVKV